MSEEKTFLEAHRQTSLTDPKLATSLQERLGNQTSQPISWEVGLTAKKEETTNASISQGRERCEVFWLKMGMKEAFRETELLDLFGKVKAGVLGTWILYIFSISVRPFISF